MARAVPRFESFTRNQFSTPSPVVALRRTAATWSALVHPLRRTTRGRRPRTSRRGPCRSTILVRRVFEIEEADLHKKWRYSANHRLRMKATPSNDSP